MSTKWIRFALVALFAAPIVLTSGCSGTTSVNPSTALHTEISGDSWTYNITGTATPTGGGAAQNVIGTATAAITTTTFNATPVQALTINASLSVNGAAATPYTIVIYFNQDHTTGDIIEYGQSTTDSSPIVTLTVQTPSIANSEIFPGTFSQGEVVTSPVTFTNSTSLNLVETIGAPSRQLTPAGQFDTWPVIITNNASPAGVEYWVPSLGMFVKGTIPYGNVNLGGTTYNLSLTYVLTGTSV